MLWAFRRLEARGLIRGGRFVSGFAGEQYASVEAIRALRETRRHKPSTTPDEIVDVLAVDPCNITGHLLPGDRVRSVGSSTIRFRNGLVHDHVSHDHVSHDHVSHDHVSMDSNELSEVPG